MSTITGPWMLYKGKDCTALVERLDQVLFRKRVVVTEYDTALDERLMHTEYDTVRDHCAISPDGVISIPLGLTLFVPSVPLIWEGAEKSAWIDIDGQHVQIAAPYFFLEDRSRVDWRRYAITAFRDAS